MVQAQIFKMRHRGIGVPNILDTINRDAEIYFASITTNHLLIVIMYAAARVGFLASVLEFNLC